MIWSPKLFRVGLALAILMFSACASKQKKIAASPQGKPIQAEQVSIDVPQVNPGMEIVGDSTRPSWVYYQYGLQAIDNHEWAVSKHYLEESLRLLVTEKYDSLKSGLTRSEDSIYKMQMPLRIVQALEDVYPNLPGEGGDSTSLDSVSIEGVDAYDENVADSASIRVIENFLDTVDAGRFSLPIRFNDRVMQEIYYMTTSARGFITRSLTRKTAYDSLIYTKLAQKRMPRDLIYLALVESGFNVKAYSRAKAGGMWQFIPETGARYGLEVDFWVDMRRNPELATDAALNYLSELHDEFGDWLLSMAAYNCGEGRIRRLLKEKQADSTWGPNRPVTYWDLQLPQETMHYVPRILAAMVIGHFPEHYDVEITKRHLPDYDTVTVFDSFSLDEIAKFLKVPEDTLRSLNMELTMWCTPPNRDAYLLRLPYGTRSAFVQNYDRMEKNGYSSWKQHKVRKGESIGNIAQMYGVRASEIQRANDMKNGRLKVGRTLLIPIKVAPRRSTGKKPSKVRTYVVQLGDNLASISRRFGISQESLRVWNNIEAWSNVKNGDTIYVSKPDLKPTSFVQQRVALKKGEKYVVKAGDTYSLIAKQFKVPVFLLLQANRGFTRRLTVGDSLSIPVYVRPARKMSGAVDDGKTVIEPPKDYDVADSQSKSKSSKKSSSSSKTSKNTTIIYTVASGDNLYAIAKKFDTSVSAIREMNEMGSSSNIKVGQKLKIPGSAASSAPSTPKVEEITHVVKKGEGLWDISRQYGVTIEDIVKWNGLKDTKIKVNEKLKIKTTKKRK
ncbi:MAG: LysM peptidoglycan-binding domain-containing protein [Fibrobacter sp.]|nr:LysM peptidoglycan-binding domain-containing protein [Fibrobacter sp.]